MFKWVQSGLSAVTGIAEPEYGPEYIHPITHTVKDKQPMTEAKREDLEWSEPSSTSVETQTFYFTDLDQGLIGFGQVIYSSVVGLHTNAQFTFKMFNINTKEQIWTSTKLEDFVVKGANFYAKDLQIQLNEEGTVYHLISNVNEESKVNLKFTRIAPAVKIGSNGVTIYGDDIKEPWGIMKHLFWPRNKAEGKISSKDPKTGEVKEFNINAYSMFVSALQGMKPHHAAATWNFLNFHSKKTSVVIMEFTTPKSYASTKVSVGFVSNDEGIIASTINNDIVHLKQTQDELNGWPKPNAIEFNIHGIKGDATDEQVKNGEGKLEVKVHGDLTLVERVDVMSEIPMFVKNIVSGVAGTKPYIYQFYNKDLTLEIGDQKETSIGYVETTFITEL